jgi:hypothetical protein
MYYCTTVSKKLKKSCRCQATIPRSRNRALISC